MTRHTGVLILASLVTFAHGQPAPECEVRARTEAGWVCGAKRQAGGAEYASFRGVPYAKQPLGELRFKELQPVDPWTGDFNATTEGPVCHQHNVYYGPLLQPRGISEACIHANVHVPIDVLPSPDEDVQSIKGLPILVFVHGGGWVCGSGDADVNGPEYLIKENKIVITFNYRLDFLGFLSLNTAQVPGNNGLRDVVTLLRWVQANARYFGGNPEDVTLAGQSAGSASVHLLTLSPATTGLFKRAWLMSGIGIQSFFSPSPVFAQQVASIFLTALNITSTDYDEVHDQLVQLPIDLLMNASRVALDTFGLTSFVPVVETPFPGVTTIIDDEPETLQANGNGKDIPLVIGFTSNECETLRPRIVQFNIVGAYQASSLIALSPDLAYSYPPNVTDEMAKKVAGRYLSADPSFDEFVKLCTETYFQYPAIKAARARAAIGGAPVFLYKYAYTPEHSVVMDALNLTFSGAGHIEDMNRIFKVNSWPVPESSADKEMTDQMTDWVDNFINNDAPSSDGSWEAASSGLLKYNNIAEPGASYGAITDYDQEMVRFFDTLADV